MYILLLFLILLALNFLDILITLRTFRKRGYKIEGNPILRDLLRDNVDSFILFKLFDIAIFCILIFWIWMKNEVFSFVLLILCIILYSYIDYKNLQAQSMFE